MSINKNSQKRTYIEESCRKAEEQGRIIFCEGDHISFMCEGDLKNPETIGVLVLTLDERANKDEWDKLMRAGLSWGSFSIRIM